MNSISFILPVFNKQSTIENVIDNIIFVCKEFKNEYEIIAIDDCSDDESWTIINNISKKTHHVRVFKNKKNIGFAKTYFKCVQYASLESALCLSTDDDIKPEELREVLRSSGSSPVVIQAFGNMSERSFVRRSISRSFTMVLNISFGLSLKYYNGCNIYPLSFLKNCNISEESFAFQAETTRLALQQFKYTEVIINGVFDDDSSTAVNFKNILGVMCYMFKALKSKLLWMP